MKNNNKKIIILLVFVISLFSFITLFTYARYTNQKNLNDTIKTKELKIEFETNGDSTFAKTHSSIVNITDTHSSNYTAKYLWSTTNDADASNGEEFESEDVIENNTLSGIYYLCINVSDDKGFNLNECSNAFAFDNTAPSISFTYNGNNTYKKSQSSVITVTNDTYGAELDEGSFKYIWSKNISDISIEPFVSGEELTKNTGAGEYYLVAIACDSLGNCATEASDVFKIDSEGPIAILNPSTGSDVRTYINYSASDSETGIVGYNITTTDTEPTTWIPVYDEVESTTEVKQEYGATWARIFHHNNRWGEVYFANSAEALSVNTLDKYSVLNNIEKYKSNGKFEFLLQYPDVDGIKYNRWTQTINPATTTIADGSGSATGYTPIHVDWTESTWGGLALSTGTATLIDGSVGINWWWYALGTYSAYNSAMPGPNTSHAATANLWVRIDGLTGVNKKTLAGRLGDLKDGTYYIWFKDALGNVSRYEQPIERTYQLKINANGGVYGTQCAAESGTCTFSGTKEVCYGANSSFICKTATGSISCTNAEFTDPISGVAKACYLNDLTGQTFKFSDALDIKNPTRNGYTFTGWKEMNGAAFATGLTSVALYNNAGNGVVTHTSQARSSDNPVSILSNEIKIVNSGTAAASPGLGGFYQAKTSEANHSYVHLFIAKLPEGYQFHVAHNAVGDGFTKEWLTSNKGTGKFQTYAYKLNAGSTGTFSTFGHVYVSKQDNNLWAMGTGAASETGTVTWYLAYSNIFDVTNGSGNVTYSPAGFGHLIGTGKLTANWSIINYTISYALNGGSASNPTSYNIDSNAFTLNNPTRTGFTFTGWTGTGLSSASTSVTVAKGSTGNRSYTANWSRINYTISYNLNGGSVSTANPTSYNVESNTFTLNNPTRAGYTFAGWSGTGLSGSANKTVTIAKGSTGNRSYTANWTANNYYLDLNGLINNKSMGGITGCGTADVYINGVQKANDVADYYTQWPTGTKYEIKDIKTTTGCTYNGVSSGSLTGTITSSNVGVQLKYTFSSRTFNYTGGMQSFTVPVTGTYKLQVYGAQGGSYSSYAGGKGGYAVGNVSLTQGNVLYIGVGGAGVANNPPSSAGAAVNNAAGYNGGGIGISSRRDTDPGRYRIAGSGGGATHIGKTNALLKDTAKANLYIAAGGGGGAWYSNIRYNTSASAGAAGGAGGGTSGGAGTYAGDGDGGNGNAPIGYAGGGTQSAGGAWGNTTDNGTGPAGSYGQGGSQTSGVNWETSGGGGGYYGGGAGRHSPGGGGSGYTTGLSSASMSNGQRTGNGTAIITFVS